MILFVLIIFFTLYGTYKTFMLYKSKQTLMFWIIEILHHLVTLFVFLGIFVQDKSFYYTLFHLLTIIFILIHWYFNLYILKIKKCSLTVLSNYFVKSKCDYTYHNPIKQLLSIENTTNKKLPCKISYLSNKPEKIDIIILGTIIVYDIFMLTYTRR